MWKISDFWKIYDFIKNGNESDLNSSLQAVSKSEQSIVERFFVKTLDQKSFIDNNSDYNQLRLFLIDWYASLKSLTSIQKDINDLYSMPDEHLDELFRSKGFNYSTKLSKYGKERFTYNYFKCFTVFWFSQFRNIRMDDVSEKINKCSRISFRIC